ncbi:MAG: chorismate mutase [Alphaproteobacteria bacterium]|nr:chorismate mutase [Alphaproteobacteria bacterium]
MDDCTKTAETAEATLAALRARIDAMDRQLADLFNARIGIIAEVAALKAAHWPNTCHIRPGREGQMHRATCDRFAHGPFPALAALAIWRQLIGASTHLESSLAVTALAAYPEHLWLAREYFGVQVGLTASATLATALETLATRRSNILILPTPTASDWWQQAEALRAAGLFIFAQLPVVADNLPAGATAAVALATVTPEPSGDDISYHLRAGELVTRDGFHPDDDGIFLGAHPRAIHLGASA